MNPISTTAGKAFRLIMPDHPFQPSGDDLANHTIEKCTYTFFPNFSSYGSAKKREFLHDDPELLYDTEQ